MTPADLRADDGEEGPAGPDFEPIVPPRKKKSGKLWLFLAVIVSVAAGAGAWQFWGESLMVDPNADIPLVRAEEGPVKVQPESPGGMEVPDRDKLVYDRIEGNEDRASVERLLPPPETPMSLPEPPATTPESETAQAGEAITESSVPPPAAPGEDADTAQAGTVQTDEAATQTEAPTVEEVLTAMRPPEPLDPQNIQEPVEPAPQAKSEPVTEPDPEPAQEQAAAPATEVQAAPKPEAAEPVAPKIDTASAFKVQLAALREENGALKEWDRLKRRHTDLLGSLEPSVMRADLGPGKGVFFRLRAGPLAGEAAAKALCEKLGERKVGCLVVRPEG